MEKLYINIPIDVKQKIDGLFNFKQKQLDKIYFLVWKINTENKHQLNIRNYSTLLGWKTGEMIKVVNALVESNIIFKSDSYVEGIKSNSYSVIKRFNISSTDFQLKYNSDFNSLPIWVQRYCADAGSAKAAKYSNFKKTEKKTLLNAEVEALKLEVEKLQELLKINNIQYDDLSSLELSKAKDEIVLAEEEKVVVWSSGDVVGLNNDNTFEIILKTKSYYFQNFNKVKQLANDEDEVYGFAQRFMNQTSPIGKVKIKDMVFGYQWAKEENDMMILID